jgi:hypothetical protein
MGGIGCRMMGGWAAVAVALTTALAAFGAAAAPESTPHDYVIKNFQFRTGETLPELKIHYYTLGAPHRDAAGHIDNAVLLLHGTGGTGRQFAAPQFADVLMAPGGLLDPATHFLIMPDGIGHGGSSKPSDGLRMKFPKYDYADMVAALPGRIGLNGVDGHRPPQAVTARQRHGQAGERHHRLGASRIGLGPDEDVHAAHRRTQDQA